MLAIMQAKRVYDDSDFGRSKQNSREKRGGLRRLTKSEGTLLDKLSHLQILRRRSLLHISTVYYHTMPALNK